MSQVDELLDTTSEDATEVSHTHSIIDSDTYFIIDPITRVIENTAHRKNILMQRDHKSERFTFELSRYIEGHDMSMCTRAEVITHSNPKQ